MTKRLFRSTTDSKLLGVCGGFAEYFDTDPTLVRVLWVAITLFFGTGILAYIICALIMPVRVSE